MKRYTLIIGVLIVQLSIVFAQHGSDYYLPLRVGNFLQTYTEGNPSGWSARTSKEFIDGTDTILGDVYYRQIGTETDQYGTSIFHVFWLRQDANGNILIGAYSDDTTVLDSAVIFPMPGLFFPNQFLTPGYAQSYEGGKDSVISITENVQTPAGNFQNCIKILSYSYDDSGNVRVLDYYWYAKNIGQIKIERTFPGDESHISLLTQYSAVVSAPRQQQPIPQELRLQQNYPNPFNPSTAIRYALPSSAMVTLTVCDMLGREIATLVNEEQHAGWNEVQWNAGEIASGIYLYQLKAGNYTEMRKMMLIK